MSQRTRKLFGALLLLALVVVYSLVAMVVATTLEVNEVKGVEFIFHVVAGLAWLPPAMLIVWWMQRP